LLLPRTVRSSVRVQVLSMALPVVGVAVAACGVVALIRSFRRRVVAVT